MAKRSSRKQEILEALAHMLEINPGERITTAKLAEAVGVSEAALYRHFPSKAKMFEGLIEFVEEAIFSRVKLIMSEETEALPRCHQLLHLLLVFTERNPGITRILNGDALAGETARLRARVQQFYERLETQLKQILREAEINEGLRPQITVSAAANLLLAAAEGRIGQYVRSEFKRPPTEYWDEQWQLLTSQFFRAAPQDQNAARTELAG
ncbi:MAG: TetR/AcrR family transcriptional regulator [Bacteroidia bacterium]|jgi:TetR/AcrR family transcriptional regulator